MNNNINIKKNLAIIDSQITAIYLTIIGSILFLILLYKKRASIIDDVYGTNYADKYPDTSNYNKIIILLLLISDAIFLYVSYYDLKRSINRYEKTGDNTGLDSAYNTFYANVLDFASSITVLYDLIVNGEASIGILP